jgi:hypothetical protein
MDDGQQCDFGRVVVESDTAAGTVRVIVCADVAEGGRAVVPYAVYRAVPVLDVADDVELAGVEGGRRASPSSVAVIRDPADPDVVMLRRIEALPEEVVYG